MIDTKELVKTLTEVDIVDLQLAADTLEACVLELSRNLHDECRRRDKIIACEVGLREALQGVLDDDEGYLDFVRWNPRRALQSPEDGA